MVYCRLDHSIPELKISSEWYSVGPFHSLYKHINYLTGLNLEVWFMGSSATSSSSARTQSNDDILTSRCQKCVRQHGSRVLSQLHSLADLAKTEPNFCNTPPAQAFQTSALLKLHVLRRQTKRLHSKKVRILQAKNEE